jgi:hypothetical protein
MKLKFVGRWAFLVGLAIAVLASFIIGYATTIALILFLLGLVIGFLNISQKDSTKFLLATIALLTGGIASMTALSVFGMVSAYLSAILGNFVAFVSAAALVVAIKVVVETGRN